MKPNGQTELQYPKSLSEKYQPDTVEAFIGLARVKAVMASFLKAPRPMAFLFLGPPGTGKTTMGLVLAKLLPAELIHVASRECDLDKVHEIARRCHYFPWAAKLWLVLVDEADQMTTAAQLAFLSKLDATEWPPNTIFIFTANATDYLEPRFLSRCHKVTFGTDNISEALPDYLLAIAKKEKAKVKALDLATIVLSSDGNVRDALHRLEVELMAGGIAEERFVPPTAAAAPQNRFQEAAAKAVETRKRNILAEAQKGAA